MEINILCRSALSAAVISILAVAPASAQFNQSINVEGKYVPEIFRIDRINSLPQHVRFSLDKTPLAYDAKGVPAAFAPFALPMPATGWNATREISSYPGYLEVGAGSWLNSTLSFGYRFINDSHTTLGVRLQHNSTSLHKPKLSQATEAIKEYRYDESLGIFGSHIFSGLGRLDAAIDYHIGNFNYYGFNPYTGTLTEPTATAPFEVTKAPTQTLNDIDARVGWQSEEHSDRISWNAAIGARYFGYRSFYLPEDYYSASEFMPMNLSPTRETDLNIAGGFKFPTSSLSALGIDLNADILFYSRPAKTTEILSIPDNYGMITLTPFYRFTRDKLNVRVGVDLDLSFNAGTKNDRYKFLHIAPDVRVDYLAGPVALYFHALGGSNLHTLAGSFERDYYQQPTLFSSRPVYSPIDGSIGFNFGPFSGFSAGLDFAFRISKGEYLGGWYQAFLNNGLNSNAALPEEFDSAPLYYSFNSDLTSNIHGYSLGLNLKYDLGKLLTLKAEGRYQPQNGEKGYFNGLDRPRWTADFSAELNPWSTLKFKLAYNYRGVRRIYTRGIYTDIVSGVENNLLTGMRLPDMCMLNFGASYNFTKAFALWLQADNLLNRHDDFLPGLPVQGVRISGGFSFLF